MSLDALEAEFLRLRLVDYLLDVEWDVSEGDSGMRADAPTSARWKRCPDGSRSVRVHGGLSLVEYPLDNEQKRCSIKLAHATRNVEHDHAASRHPVPQDDSADDDLDESLEQASAIAALCRRVMNWEGRGTAFPS